MQNLTEKQSEKFFDNSNSFKTIKKLFLAITYDEVKHVPFRVYLVNPSDEWLSVSQVQGSFEEDLYLGWGHMQTFRMRPNDYHLLDHMEGCGELDFTTWYQLFITTENKDAYRITDSVSGRLLYGKDENNREKLPVLGEKGIYLNDWGSIEKFKNEGNLLIPPIYYSERDYEQEHLNSNAIKNPVECLKNLKEYGGITDEEYRQALEIIKEGKKNKRVWFIRHAQSQSNADKSFKSDDFASATVPLSEGGIKQAEGLAQRFPSKPDLIIVSPYLRAKQTAMPLIQKYPNMPVEEWPIQEFTYLSEDRCVGTTISERKPWVDEYWEKGDPFYSDGDGAESWLSFINRASDIIEKIKSRKEKFIVLFSHEYFIAAIKYILSKEEYEITPNHIKDFRQYFLSNRIPNASKVEFILKDCQTPD